MKTLIIEWKHLDVEGETCNRCYDTGENLAQEIKRLNRTLQPHGIEVELTETKLDDTKIPQSNTILFNGVPIEDILNIEVSENYCDSCTNLLGTNTFCRTVMYEGSEYEDIPAKAIRQAAFKVLGIEEAKVPAENSGCGCNSSSCCPPPAESWVPTGQSACCAPLGTDSSTTSSKKRHLDIEFLFLDLNVCVPCRGTDSSLEEAISEVSSVLEATGIEVNVRKIHVQSEEQALELGFVSSPTIRINGRDIQLEVRESLCESCGDLCGDDVDCRVWVYRGKEYSVPPKGLIIEAILREVYKEPGEDAAIPPRPTELPDNLKKFFAARQKNESNKD